MTREQRGPIGSESDSNNPFVLWIVVEAVGVETLIEVGVGVIAAIGTLVIPRKKDPWEECLDKYVECQGTLLGKLEVDKWGTTVCASCLNLCKKNGEWPAGFERTRGWQTCL